MEILVYTAGEINGARLELGFFFFLWHLSKLQTTQKHPKFNVASVGSVSRRKLIKSFW